jgi:Eukaryotic aspartyl protease
VLTPTVDLSTAGNVAYTGPLFMGTPLQGTNSSTFIYDSSASYLMVGGSNCTTCSSQYYNPDLSLTVAPSLEYNARTMGYGDAKFAGYMIEDDVCLSNY